MHWLIANHQLMPSSAWQQGPENRAFRFGDGFFETMLLRHGRLQWAQRHAARLARAVAVFRMQSPNGLDAEGLQHLASQLAQANETDSLRLRLSCYRAPGGLYLPTDNQLHYLLEAWPLTQTPSEGPRRAIVYQDAYTHASPWSAFKTLGSQLYTLAALEAQAQGAQEALLCSPDGHLAEATSSNLFGYRHQTLYTPPTASSGCVEGILRSVLIEHGGRFGLRVVEETWLPSELGQFEELFTTNAIHGPRPIHQVGNLRFGSRVCAELSHQVAEAYQQGLS